MRIFPTAQVTKRVRSITVVALASLRCTGAALAAAFATTVPQTPVERQRVFVHYQTQALCEAQIDADLTRVSMSGNVVDVALVMPEQPRGCTNFGADLLIEIGELPVGVYSVDVGVAEIEPYLQGASEKAPRFVI